MIAVLIVEDEREVARAHEDYVARVPGFTVAGVVHSGAEALRFCAREPVELVLLDFYLPDMHGLAVCRALRGVDVIAVTSARDLAVVKDAVSSGVVQYLLKPFAFATLREKLTRYARFREQAARSGEVSDQAELDGMFAALRAPDHHALPKGMSRSTLDAVRAVLGTAEQGLSAAAVAEAIGATRVTARRYLEYLADNGIARRAPHYGQVGRPEVHFFSID
ncbi:response regulator [Sciscionella marina]|uniref:response regulator n=1 Tax=Sciscionella marina TaxID=508770 RepID=UPI00035EB223|nr:response regulator [Sciscionella marina]